MTIPTLYMDSANCSCGKTRNITIPIKQWTACFKQRRKVTSFQHMLLASCFSRADEVPKNVDCALRWLEEAVVKENQYAEYLLGKNIADGRGYRAGRHSWRRTAETLLPDKEIPPPKYLHGKSYLEGVLLMQNIPEGIRLITEAADGGSAPAQYLIGKLLYQGQVVPQNLQRAIFYLDQAAEKENAYAAYLAGKIRLTEEGFKDVPKAIRLFQIAAAQQNSFAEFQLGLLYLRGKDVVRNEREAIRWLTLSAEHGNPYAAQLLHGIKSNQNWSAALGTLRLLQHLFSHVPKPPGG